MRKIGWLFGFCCDVTVLILVGGIVLSTYQASLVEPSEPITPPEVILPEGLEPLVPEHKEQPCPHLVGRY